PPSFSFVFPAPSPSVIYTLSLHDALPIFGLLSFDLFDLLFGLNFEWSFCFWFGFFRHLRNDVLWLCHFDVTFHQLVRFLSDLHRSEEHTSELQSRFDLVCRLLLEKKKKTA